ncbi:hypothetical protein ACUTAF_19605 [Pseudomonas sp. SP16.1]|uniref:hypothetical protein n=1 Tax=Pseudomonas sp. SP16.1 TaxID=3458854 RepID=UPI0040463B16
MNELHALVDRALVGDKEALSQAVELAEALALEQALAGAPAGLRAEALAGLKALWKARRARAKRQRATAESNRRRGADHQAKIDNVLGPLALHDKASRDLTGIVHRALKKYKRELKKKTGLRKVPCQTAIRRRIKKNTSTGVPVN